MAIPVLPKGLDLVDTQVAGHTFQDSSEAVGMLRDKEGGFIFKSSTKKACVERERAFYERVTSDPALVEMRSFVPRYFGTKVVQIRGKDVEFFKMTDFTAGMEEPCVMDCKIGRRTWDPLATEEKRVAESSKYVRSRASLGFCIPGFQVFSLSASKVKRYGREYGKALDENSVYEAMRIFLNADTCLFRPLVSRILATLREITAWVEKQRVFTIYSSSILIVYDAKRLKEEMKAKAVGRELGKLKLDALVPPSGAQTADWIFVKMIDFAHVFPNEDLQVDANYLEGIRGLVGILERLLEEAES